jgi:hypothetical protein
VDARESAAKARIQRGVRQANSGTRLVHSGQVDHATAEAIVQSAGGVGGLAALASPIGTPTGDLYFMADY